MKKGVAMLAVALSASAVADASTCRARVEASPSTWSACGRASTPARGSTTRKQIADAMRRSLGAATGVYAVFNFDWIKVNGSWAFAKTRPESPDGLNKYEPVWALLRRSNGLWRVQARIMGDSESSPEQQLHAAKRRYPNAPRDIFPH